MKKILCTLKINESKQQEWMNTYPDFEFVFKAKKDVTDADVQTADVWIGNGNPQQVRLFKGEWLQLESAGADHVIKNLSGKVILTNATGAYGEAISEHMLASLFYFAKKIDRYAANQKRSQWQNEGQVICIGEQTVLVLGLGDIGQEFAKRMKALGSKVIGLKKRVGEKPDYVDELVYYDDLKTVLPQADIVACCLPSTEETYHVLNDATLALMKQGSMLLNVGRGNCIDTDALIRQLQQGRFSGVALDVCEVEPLPLNSPLWRFDRVLITPHVSGNYNMAKTYQKVVSLVEENLAHYAKQEPLRNVVNRKLGYKE